MEIMNTNSAKLSNFKLLTFQICNTLPSLALIKINFTTNFYIMRISLIYYIFKLFYYVFYVPITIHNCKYVYVCVDPFWNSKNVLMFNLSGWFLVANRIKLVFYWISIYYVFSSLVVFYSIVFFLLFVKYNTSYMILLIIYNVYLF